MRYMVKMNQKVYEVEVERIEKAEGTHRETVEVPAAAEILAAESVPAVSAQTVSVQNIRVESPMPGKILSITASIGQQVSAGQGLFILEAMKMENEIVAPQSGIVKQILVSQGTNVDTGTVLAVIA